MDALNGFVYEAISQKDSLYQALQQDFHSPPKDPDPDSLEWHDRPGGTKTASYWAPPSEVQKLVRQFGCILGKLHSAAIAEAAGTFPHLPPLMDQLAELHEALVDDSLGRSGQSRQFTPDVQIRWNEAVNRLVPYANARGQRTVKNGLAEPTGNNHEPTAIPVEAVTGDELQILACLDKHHPVLMRQADIAADTLFAEKYTRECLGRLRDAGYTHRPNGDRKGETITKQGQTLLNSAAK